MIVETPDPALFSAAMLMAAADTAGDVAGMAVVMKVAYDLVAEGTNPRRMVAVADPSRSAVVMADQGTTRFTATDVNPQIISRVVGPGDFAMRGDPEKQVLVVDGVEFTLEQIEADAGKELTFDLTYEADTALAKDRADIVVTGFIPVSQAGAVVVDATTWLTRTPPPLPPSPDADMTRNLFGFEPRLGTARQALSGVSSAFAPLHRRGPGVFDDEDTGDVLPSNGVVGIFQGTDLSGSPDYALRLPDLDQSVRLRVYCGHGPDVAPRWRKVELGPMRPDTLFVHPATHRAEILWRRRWNADLEPEDRYRSVQIRAGGA